MTLEFGTFKENEINFETQKPHSICRRGDDIYVATNKAISLIKDNLIIKTYNFPSTAMLFIEEHMTLILATPAPTRIQALFVQEKLKNVEKLFDIEQILGHLDIMK